MKKILYSMLLIGLVLILTPATAGCSILSQEDLDAAYDDGYQEGYEEGYGEGISDGYNQGYDDGYVDHFEIGRSYLEDYSTYNDEVGISYLTIAIELYPDRGEYYFERSSAYFSWATHLEDIKYDRETSGEEYTNTDYDMALPYLIEVNYDNALLDVNKAIELGYESADAYFIRGLCHSINGDYLDAVADYTICIDMTSPDTDPGQLGKYYRFRGQLYGYYLDEKDKALNDLALALELTENDFIKGLILGYIEEISSNP